MNQQQMEALLQQAAAQLGTTTDQLKEMASSGKLEQLLNESISGPAGQINQILNDPETTRKLLFSPQAQDLLSWLNRDSRWN